MKHDLIKTGDPDVFCAIQDRNGEVCLDYCRRCNKGEGELVGVGCILTCKHCEFEFQPEHNEDHPGLCCDCFDLGWFPESLDKINAERAVKGKLPISIKAQVEANRK